MIPRCSRTWGQGGKIRECPIPLFALTLYSQSFSLLPSPLTIPDPPHPYISFLFLLFFFWQNSLACLPFIHPPPIAPSSTSFSPCLSCLLAQSLNLLEPKDPVCYVNGLNTDTRVLTCCMYTLMPAHTNPLSLHIHTCTHVRTHTHTHVCTCTRSAIGPNLALQLLAGVQLSPGLHYRSLADAVFT